LAASSVFLGCPKIEHCAPRLDKLGKINVTKRGHPGGTRPFDQFRLIWIEALNQTMTMKERAEILILTACSAFWLLLIVL
jgi:hypothetical protein